MANISCDFVSYSNGLVGHDRPISLGSKPAVFLFKTIPVPSFN